MYKWGDIFFNFIFADFPLPKQLLLPLLLWFRDTNDPIVRCIFSRVGHLVIFLSRRRHFFHHPWWEVVEYFCGWRWYFLSKKSSREWWCLQYSHREWVSPRSISQRLLEWVRSSGGKSRRDWQSGCLEWIQYQPKQLVYDGCGNRRIPCNVGICPDIHNSHSRVLIVSNPLP